MIRLIYSLIVLLLVSLSFDSHALERICKMPSSKTQLKIVYDGDLASNVYQRSSESQPWQKLDVFVRTISGSSQESIEYVSVQPTLQDIDWSKQKQYYFVTGTQWYFHFLNDEPLDRVQIAPYVQTQSNKCIPPRFPPKLAIVDCKLHW